MNGTVIGTINVYFLDRRIAMQAREDDRVNIIDGLLYRLERNGVVKLSGVYSIDLNYVRMDEVEEPPPPVEGMQNVRLTDLDTNEFWDFVRKPNA